MDNTVAAHCSPTFSPAPRNKSSSAPRRTNSPPGQGLLTHDLAQSPVASVIFCLSQRTEHFVLDGPTHCLTHSPRLSSFPLHRHRPPLTFWPASEDKDTPDFQELSRIKGRHYRALKRIDLTSFFSVVVVFWVVKSGGAVL